MKNILLAGGTGYLGKFILTELEKYDYKIKAVVRNKKKLSDYDEAKTEIISAEVTKPETLENICKNVDVVISSIGITKQKDGLTYDQVDYQANLNLLNEAKKNGVKKFIYVSVLNGEKLRKLKICEAKENFVEELKNSCLEYCVIRPNGFFSDMSEIFQMAKSGRVYLFGSGLYKSNPIHGEDLAKVIVDNITSDLSEIKVGGPQTLTQIEIATLAFDIVGTKIKITRIPDFVRKISIKILRLFTSIKIYGPLEFFMTVLAMDMIAPEYGKLTLKEYFEKLNRL